MLEVETSYYINMKKYIFSLSFILVSLVSASTKPNIIIFYVDDLGWQDVQLNDLDEPCAYDTPHIKKLAEAGMNFSLAFSSAPTCSPSRAGIITGQHPAKIGLTHVDLSIIKAGVADQRLVSPYIQGPMDLKLLTLADALKANGYRTGHSGKWHVGSTAASYGFDVVNQERGAHRRMVDRTKGFATDNDRKYPLSEEKYFPTSEKKPDGISYPYDEVTESALDFMEKSKGEPFFLNLCHWMVHWPMLTRNGELLEYYCDKFGQPFPPKPGDMTLAGQQNPYFASMVTTVDWSLGRIVAYLEKTDDPRNPGKKLSETTYIFFSSDNGGAEKKGREILSDNAPLKYGKKRPEEGGIRVPMIVTGPSVKPSSEFAGLVNQLDYFPTIMKLTSSKISAEDEKALSGLDISPVFTGQSDKILDSNGVERDHLFWHFPHNTHKSAIRSRDYKLYKRHDTDDYELYEITKDGKRNDFEEANDLAQNPDYKEVVDHLGKALDADLLANNAEGPYLNPAFKDKKTPSAIISKSEFDSVSRKATLILDESGPAIKSAYVIYLRGEGVKKVKHKASAVGLLDSDQRPGMRSVVEVNEQTHMISAVIPAGIENHCFVIIDTNGYMTYSNLSTIKKTGKEVK